MAALTKPLVPEHDIHGLQYFRLLGPLFAHLHTAGTERDRAGNRQLFYDQYATLLLVYCFSPTVTSLRGLQQATTLAKVQARLGVRRTSLGALSKAASVFDAALLHWVGRGPPKRTYEMLCFYLSGWVSEEELVAHIDRLHLKAPPLRKN